MRMTESQIRRVVRHILSESAQNLSDEDKAYAFTSFCMVTRHQDAERFLSYISRAFDSDIIRLLNPVSQQFLTQARSWLQSGTSDPRIAGLADVELSNRLRKNIYSKFGDMLSHGTAISSRMYDLVNHIYRVLRSGERTSVYDSNALDRYILNAVQVTERFMDRHSAEIPEYVEMMRDIAVVSDALPRMDDEYKEKIYDLVEEPGLGGLRQAAELVGVLAPEAPVPTVPMTVEQMMKLMKEKAAAGSNNDSEET